MNEIVSCKNNISENLNNDFANICKTCGENFSDSYAFEVLGTVQVQPTFVWVEPAWS